MVVPAYADEFYKHVIVKTTLVKVESDFGDYLKLDLPFPIYGVNIVTNGVDVTYSMNNLALEGVEVIAKVDHSVKDQAEVAKFPGRIGKKWKDVQKHADYVKHYKHKKEDTLATYTDNLNGTFTKVPYKGQNKNELVKFTQWEE